MNGSISSTGFCYGWTTDSFAGHGSTDNWMSRNSPSGFFWNSTRHSVRSRSRLGSTGGPSGWGWGDSRSPDSVTTPADRQGHPRRPRHLWHSPIPDTGGTLGVSKRRERMICPVYGRTANYRVPTGGTQGRTRCVTRRPRNGGRGNTTHSDTLLSPVALHLNSSRPGPTTPLVLLKGSELDPGSPRGWGTVRRTGRGGSWWRWGDTSRVRDGCHLDGGRMTENTGRGRKRLGWDKGLRWVPRTTCPTRTIRKDGKPGNPSVPPSTSRWPLYTGSARSRNKR